MKKRIVKVGNVVIGKEDDIVIQSMTNIQTSKTKKNLNQIKTLFKLGCKLVRVSVDNFKDIKSLKKITINSPCPIIADIQYNPKLAIAAIEAGAKGIRINPANILDQNLFIKILRVAKIHKVAIRIGINTGSLKNNIKTDNQIINFLKKYIIICEKNNFFNLVLSLKSPSVEKTINLSLLANKLFNYPIHVGITEAGDITTATIRTTLLIRQLIMKKAINTFRISITDDPTIEPIIAKKILHECGVKQNLTNYISCPTCGRCKINLKKILKKIKKILDENPSNLIKVALMGCVVNGLNEVKKADIGFYGVNKKCHLYYKGESVGIMSTKKTIKKFKNLYIKLINQKNHLFF